MEVSEHLASASLLALPPSGIASRHLLATTGDTALFRCHLHRFLPEAVAAARVVGAAWRDNNLTLE